MGPLKLLSELSAMSTYAAWEQRSLGEGPRVPQPLVLESKEHVHHPRLPRREPRWQSGVFPCHPLQSSRRVSNTDGKAAFTTEDFPLAAASKRGLEAGRVPGRPQGRLPRWRSGRPGRRGAWHLIALGSGAGTQLPCSWGPRASLC